MHIHDIVQIDLYTCIYIIRVAMQFTFSPLSIIVFQNSDTPRDECDIQQLVSLANSDTHSMVAGAASLHSMLAGGTN